MVGLIICSNSVSASALDWLGWLAGSQYNEQKAPRAATGSDGAVALCPVAMVVVGGCGSVGRSVHGREGTWVVGVVLF